MKLINPILLTLNNTLHIKADNLEPVEVDSSCVDGILLSIDHKIPQFSLSEGINISELSDRIEVRDKVLTIIDNKWVYVKRAFLRPEKEDKCDGKCVPNECLCEWEDMTKEQVKAEALPSITEKYGKSFEKSYTIEEIEKALNKTNYNEGHPLTNKFIGCFFGELTKINNLKK